MLTMADKLCTYTFTLPSGRVIGEVKLAENASLETLRTEYLKFIDTIEIDKLPNLSEINTLTIDKKLYSHLGDNVILTNDLTSYLENVDYTKTVGFKFNEPVYHDGIEYTSITAIAKLINDGVELTNESGEVVTNLEDIIKWKNFKIILNDFKTTLDDKDYQEIEYQEIKSDDTSVAIALPYGASNNKNIVSIMKYILSKSETFKNLVESSNSSFFTASVQDRVQHALDYFPSFLSHADINQAALNDCFKELFTSYDSNMRPLSFDTTKLSSDMKSVVPDYKALNKIKKFVISNLKGSKKIKTSTVEKMPDKFIRNWNYTNYRPGTIHEAKYRDLIKVNGNQYLYVNSKNDRGLVHYMYDLSNNLVVFSDDFLASANIELNPYQYRKFPNIENLDLNINEQFGVKINFNNNLDLNRYSGSLITLKTGKFILLNNNQVYNISTRKVGSIAANSEIIIYPRVQGKQYDTITDNNILKIGDKLYKIIEGTLTVIESGNPDLEITTNNNTIIYKGINYVINILNKELSLLKENHYIITKNNLELLPLLNLNDDIKINNTIYTINQIKINEDGSTNYVFTNGKELIKSKDGELLFNGTPLNEIHVYSEYNFEPFWYALNQVNGLLAFDSRASAEEAITAMELAGTAIDGLRVVQKKLNKYNNVDHNGTDKWIIEGANGSYYYRDTKGYNKYYPKNINLSKLDKAMYVKLNEVANANNKIYKSKYWRIVNKNEDGTYLLSLSYNNQTSYKVLTQAELEAQLYDVLVPITNSASPTKLVKSTDGISNKVEDLSKLNNLISIVETKLGINVIKGFPQGLSEQLPSTTKAFLYEGNIYLRHDSNVSDLTHEYLHLIFNILKSENIDLYSTVLKTIYDGVKDKKYIYKYGEILKEDPKGISVDSIFDKLSKNILYKDLDWYSKLEEITIRLLTLNDKSSNIIIDTFSNNNIDLFASIDLAVSKLTGNKLTGNTTLRNSSIKNAITEIKATDALSAYIKNKLIKEEC